MFKVATIDLWDQHGAPLHCADQPIVLIAQLYLP